MSERKCPACRAAVAADNAFCPHCGERLSEASPSGAHRVNVDGVLRRAELALADGAFDRAHAFCETALNEDPECATAYLYHLLAELRLRDRAALADAPELFDESDHYKKAFRFGDEALRGELLSALYAIDARETERGQAALYEKAVAALAVAEDIPAALAAEKAFLSLGEYRDAPSQAEKCRARCEELRAAWGALKEQKREAVAAKRKEDKKILLGMLGALALALAVVVAVVLAIYVFKPNSMRKDALAMMASGDYYDALDLLAEAEKQALFEGTREAIAEAEAQIKQGLAEHKAALKKEEERLAAERARAREIELAVRRAALMIEEGEFLAGIREMLGVNVPVCLQYEAKDAEVWLGKEQIEGAVWYENAGVCPDIATAKRDAYVFEKWTSVSCEYDATTGVCTVILQAKFAAYGYKLSYVLGGGEADNPERYGVTTPTFTLKPPVRHGYVFLGWTGTGLSDITPEVTIETGSTGYRYYTAHWRAISSRVTLDAKEGDVFENELTATFDEPLALPVPVRDGYRFRGWYLGNEPVEISPWQLTEDVTLWAKWEIVSYQITYALGEVPAANGNPTFYTVKTGKIVLQDLTHPYCTFLGWYTDTSYTTRVREISADARQDVSLVAKWHIPSFTVTLDLNGGTGVASTRTYSALSLPLSLSSLVPEKENHSFYYWAKDEMDGVPVDTLDACRNVTLVANYLPDGTEILIIHGGGFEGERCQARYWPRAHGATVQADLVFPKYHRVSYFKDSPYIQMINLVNASGLQSMSYSDQVIQAGCPTGVAIKVRR